MTGTYHSEDNKLVIHVVDMINEKGSQIAVRFFGKSQMKNPGDFMNPILRNVLDYAQKTKLNIVLDFCNLDFMNSSTVAPILKYWSVIKETGLHLTIVYRNELAWQKTSFSVFSIFAEDTGRFQLIAK